MSFIWEHNGWINQYKTTGYKYTINHNGWVQRKNKKVMGIRWSVAVFVIDSLGPSSTPRRLRRCLQSLVCVIYSLSPSDTSVVVAESSGPSSSYDANAAVINSTHRRLRHPRRSLKRVISSASSIDSSVVVVESLGSSLSDDASVDLGVVTTMMCPHSPTPSQKTVQVVVLVIKK